MSFAKRCYLGAIQAGDTRAESLTIEKARQLANWAECHPSDYFEPYPIQFALNMYHQSAAWDTLQGLFEEADEEEVEAAVRAYNRGLCCVCRLSGPKLQSARLTFKS